MQLQIKLLRKGAVCPRYAIEGSAGLDLHACLGSDDDEELTYTIAAGHRSTIPTGIAVKLPANHVGLVCPRSGLARHRGVTVLNAPGVIDEDFVGELAVILINQSPEDFVIRHRDRIAQLVIMPVANCGTVIVDSLPETARGDRGFGSTGSDAIREAKRRADAELRSLHAGRASPSFLERHRDK